MPRHMPLTLAQEDIKVFEAEENKVSEAEETWSRPKVPLHAFASDCTATPGPNPQTAVAAATTPKVDDAERAATPKMDDAERAALRERVAALERQINSVTAAAKATKAEQEAAVKMQSVSRGFFGRRALASKKATAALAPTPNLRVRRLPPPPIISLIYPRSPKPGSRPFTFHLQAAVRTVQATVVLQRKLTRRRQGLVEGRHAPLPPSLPPGLPEASGSPAAGRVALRRTEGSQAFPARVRVKPAPQQRASSSNKPSPELDDLLARVELLTRDRGPERPPEERSDR